MAENSNEKPLVGISTCLLGFEVRYDGGHKLDRYLRDTLGHFVRWFQVCPETESGFGIPREAFRLVGDVDAPRLITNKTHRDVTGIMQEWARKRLEEIAKEPLCGFIFKAKSPSSGMERVKVYLENGIPVKRGVGVFARAFMERFPTLPVEEEGRLHDMGLRENFIVRVFTYHRWRTMLAENPSHGGLVDFHSRQKLLLMAHQPHAARELGGLVAHATRESLADVLKSYEKKLMDTLKLQANPGTHTNVLHHIMGYFKKHISADEKKELLEVIDHYRNGLVPLVVPITLINHFQRIYPHEYLRDQVYLAPGPLELRLRNHC